MASVEIYFENEKQFLSGETVTGKIEIKLKENIKVKELILAVRGRARVQWEKRSFYICYNEKTIYTGKETFFNSIVPLIPNETELPAGNHKYEFEFVIPKNCPASTGKSYYDIHVIRNKGYEIKYEAVVYFVRPRKFDLKFEKEFKVLHGFDLNLSPTLIVPILQADNESLTSIARLGYVVGDEIPVNVQIKNPNDNRIERIVCSLNKIVSHAFISNTSKICSKTSDTKISEKIAVFSPGQAEYKFWLNIPGENNPPSTVNPNMRLVNIQYKLIVKLQEKKMKYFFQDVSEMEFPIVIGAIPLQQTNIS